MTMMRRPAPFLKWAGGKTDLVHQILELASTKGIVVTATDRESGWLPVGIDSYVEPMVGGGALFFGLRARGFRGSCVLADTNLDLMLTYRVVRDEINALLDRVTGLRHGERHYSRARDLFNSRKTDEVQRAALMLYLNKTCFNGLWRVDSRGNMNAPIGDYKKPRPFDASAEDVLKVASIALQGVRLICTRVDEIGRWEMVPCVDGSMARQQTLDPPVIGPGCLVYLDPPYIPIPGKPSFVGYQATKFGLASHLRLVEQARAWAEAGATVVLSASDTPASRAIYGAPRGLTVHEARMTRSINSVGHKRGHVGELLVLARKELP